MRVAWSSPFAFFLACVGLLSIALIQGAKPFYYDALNYWMLGESFISHGDFSLLNFNSPLRGYLLPLIDHGLQELAVGVGWSSSTSVRVFNALTIALIGAVLAPELAALAWTETRWNLWRRLALAALFGVFWGGYLSYPLSDFPALAFALVALIACARPLAPAWMLLAGVATGAAIDARPSYVALLALIPALVVWRMVELRSGAQRSIARALSCVALLCVGFAAISLPQALASHRHFATWSFVPGAAAHLESLQLTEGLRLQRYETFVGAGHPPQMFYEDPSGIRLLSEQAGQTVTGVDMYLSLTLDHPSTVLGLFIRHIVNGFDQRYNTPYIERLDTGSHDWMRGASFMLVFLALLRVLWPCARRRLGVARWRYPVALLACCVTSVPSAMETRFLLPAYTLTYMLVVGAGWPNPLARGPSGRRQYRTTALVLMSMAIYVVAVSP